MRENAESIAARLEELLTEIGVPGASVAVLDRDAVYQVNAGLANVETGAVVTHETIFPIGSITKVFTTCLILSLVEDERLSLDQPVTAYVPDLRFEGGCITDDILLRDLLTHTSGIPGDLIYDPGTVRPVETYVRHMATLPPLHGPRELFSYSNAAFILAGYLVEEVTGRSWHEIVRTRLLEPLELSSMTTLPADRSATCTAAPHVWDADSGTWRVGDMWLEFHAGAPAGFTPYATAADMVEFARFHSALGRTRSGRQLLSAPSIASMQEPFVTELPSGAFDSTGWGLGWALHRYGSERVIGHNGGTSAMLRVLPDQGFAVAVLTNVSGGIRLGQRLITEIVQHRFGVTPDSAPPRGDPQGLDAPRLAGTYRHLDNEAVIHAGKSGLTLSTASKSGKTKEVILTPLESGAMLADFPERGPSRVGFAGWDEDGRSAYFHMGLRAYRRVHDEETASDA